MKIQLFVIFFASYLSLSLSLSPDGYYCSSASECLNGHCVHSYCSSYSYYCGDGYCDAGESYSSCYSDCQNYRPDGTSCYYASQCTGGYCVHGYCRSSSYYCGDNYCDAWAGETCSECASDCKKCDGESCSSASECYNNYCVHNKCRSSSYYCGDSYCDASYESYWTCCKDCSCPSGKVCDTISGNCVECVSNNDCLSSQRCYLAWNTCVNCLEDSDCSSGRCDTDSHSCVGCILDSDCKQYVEWSGVYSCSADNTKVVESGTVMLGKCSWNKECDYSTGGAASPRDVANCRYQGTYCQDNKCGCSTGYDKCDAEGKCVKVGELDVGSPCGCNFQCSSGYCKNNVCIKTATTILSATKSVLNTSEKTDVTLSVDNDLNERAVYNVVLSIGSGASISGISAGQSCSGNQCKSSGKLEPKSKQEVSVEITPQQAGLIEFTASVTVETEAGVVITLPDKTLTIDIKKCGDNVCSPEVGESTQTCCTDCKCKKSNFLFEYSCKTKSNSCSTTFRTFWWFNIGILGVITFFVIMFKQQIIEIVKGKMEEEKQEKEEIKTKEEAIKKQEQLTKQEEKQRVEQGKKMPVKDVQKQLKEVLIERERGRGISLQRIIDGMPYIPQGRVEEALDNLISEGFVVRSGKGFFMLSKNIEKPQTSEENDVLATMKRLDRGRGVSTRRLQQQLNISDDELQTQLDNLLSQKKISKISEEHYKVK